MKKKKMTVGTWVTLLAVALNLASAGMSWYRMHQAQVVAQHAYEIGVMEGLRRCGKVVVADNAPLR